MDLSGLAPATGVVFVDALAVSFLEVVVENDFGCYPLTRRKQPTLRYFVLACSNHSALTFATSQAMAAVRTARRRGSTRLLRARSRR